MLLGLRVPLRVVKLVVVLTRAECSRYWYDDKDGDVYLCITLS